MFQVIIDPKGALVWESTSNRKSPETDTPSPSDKAEVLRKTEAKRKRGERRSTQQVKLEDLPDALTPEKPVAAEDPVASANRENHLQSVNSNHLSNHLSHHRTCVCIVSLS